MRLNLTYQQAQSCENAAGDRCRCRCGGQFHGVGRRADVRELPPDDPHYPRTCCPECGALTTIKALCQPCSVKWAEQMQLGVGS